MSKLAIVAFCLLVSGGCLFGQSSTDLRSSAEADTNQIRPPAFPTPEEAAEIKTARVVRKYPEVGFQIGASFGWLETSRLSESYRRTESQYGVLQHNDFADEQFSPELGVRISFSRKIVSLFQWSFGGEPNAGGFRYSLASANILYSPLCSKEFYLFLGAGIGRYQLKAKRSYNQTLEGGGILREIKLEDCSQTVAPLLAMIEFRPVHSPQYSLFFMIRRIPNNTKSFATPLAATHSGNVDFQADMGGTWMTVGISYGI